MILYDIQFIYLAHIFAFYLAYVLTLFLGLIMTFFLGSGILPGQSIWHLFLHSALDVYLLQARRNLERASGPVVPGWARKSKKELCYILKHQSPILTWELK